MNTETRIRDAYEQLAATAPSIADLDLDVSHGIAHRRVRERHGRHLRIALATATVFAVVLGAAVVSRATRHDPAAAPTSFVPATSLDFDATWDFGPNSFPGLQLVWSQLTPDRKDYTYAGAGRGSSRTFASVSTFRADAAVYAELADLTPTPIGGVDGYSGVLTEGTDELHQVLGAVPSPPGKGQPPTSAPYVFWPLGGDRWAALTATADSYPQDPHGRPVSQPIPELVQTAAGASVETDANLAFVKVAYLPADAQFSDVVAQRADPLAVREEALGPEGLPSRANRAIDFVVRGSSTLALSISAVLGPEWPLTDGGDNQLPQEVDGPRGPFDPTTIRGHRAFVSDNCIVIQWGEVEIALTDASRYNTDGHPMYPRSELLKVAESLTVSSNAEAGHGYPLLESLPASAFG